MGGPKGDDVGSFQEWVVKGVDCTRGHINKEKVRYIFTCDSGFTLWDDNLPKDRVYLSTILVRVFSNEDVEMDIDKNLSLKDLMREREGKDIL